MPHAVMGGASICSGRSGVGASLHGGQCWLMTKTSMKKAAAAGCVGAEGCPGCGLVLVVGVMVVVKASTRER